MSFNLDLTELQMIGSKVHVTIHIPNTIVYDDWYMYINFMLIIKF